MQTVEKWGVFEAAVCGPQGGEPLLGRCFRAGVPGEWGTGEGGGVFGGGGN